MSFSPYRTLMRRHKVVYRCPRFLPPSYHGCSHRSLCVIVWFLFIVLSSHKYVHIKSMSINIVRRIGIEESNTSLQYKQKMGEVLVRVQSVKMEKNVFVKNYGAVTTSLVRTDVKSLRMEATPRLFLNFTLLQVYFLGKYHTVSEFF